MRPPGSSLGGLSGRSLRRTLRVQVVAGDARASSPRAPCRLARVSMKPRCRLHEPIRFINCSTSSFYSSIFIQIRGICVPIRKRKMFSRERGRVPHKAKAKPKDTKLIASSLSIECFGKKFFFLDPSGGGPLSGRERAFRLRSPNYPYLPCICCLVFCQFESPRFVTW